MYWIYLILFVIIVFVPDIVVGDVYFIGEEKMEELMIFVLGSVIMLLLIFKDKQFKFNLEEKSEIQKNFHETSRDLNNSYSYIGEANRKLEILKNISLKLTSVSGADEEERQRIFIAIRDAVKVLSKTDDFMIKFVDIKKKRVVDDLPGYEPKSHCDTSKNMQVVFENEKSIIKENDCVIVRSVGDMNGIVAVVMFHYDQDGFPEDVELIQTLATQALSLHSSVK